MKRGQTTESGQLSIPESSPGLVTEKVSGFLTVSVIDVRAIGSTRPAAQSSHVALILRRIRAVWVDCGTTNRGRRQ